MTDLCKLAAKYGTDKTHYTPFYSMLLEAKRETTRTVLEIGIGTQEAMKHVPGYLPGASLRMWREYFPNADIYGLDKDPSVLFAAERINTAWVEQERAETFVPLFFAEDKFDLIVDDGSHKAHDQLITLDMLLPHCTGLYIIEDADIKGGLLEQLEVPYSYVQVKGTLTGHCVVIRGKH